MAKKRTIEEVETSTPSHGVQSKKKKTKKVQDDSFATILSLYSNKSKFATLNFRENGQTNSACWCSVHVVSRTGMKKAKIFNLLLA